MGEYDDLVRQEVSEGLRQIWREEMALLCLGPPGEHFAADDWERRADLLASDPGGYLQGDYAN